MHMITNLVFFCSSSNRVVQSPCARSSMARRMSFIGRRNAPHTCLFQLAIELVDRTGKRSPNDCRRHHSRILRRFNRITDCPRRGESSRTCREESVCYPSSSHTPTDAKVMRIKVGHINSETFIDARKRR